MTNSAESTENDDSTADHSALPSDRDLLRRFIHDGDEPSFAAIVERHATLVMSVCRRVVGQSPDVDDAFQATFFALSQRPASIYECRSLSGWLYSVAWRASVRLVRQRKRTMTQPLPEQVSASEPDPLDVIAQANDLASLDEELNELPQKYRDVLVMSYFAQQTNQEIADQLNESKGAIDGRIRDARRMLRVRLARRGVEIGVLVAATAYVQSSASAASPVLIQKAISLGAPGLVSQELAALNAAEVAQMKFLTSTGIPLMSKVGLTIAAGLVLATGLWGMTKLAAFQEGNGGSGSVALDSITGDAADAKQSTENVSVELSGQTEAVVTAQESVEVVSAAPVNPVNDSGSVASDMPAAEPRRKLTGAAAEFSRSSARKVDEQLNQIIQTSLVKNLLFPGENPLTDILDQIATHMTDTHKKRYQFLPDFKALDEDSVVLNDVMIRDIELDGIALSSALDLILRQTNPPLTWVVRDEVVLITTLSAADSEDYMFLRSYDISRLREISQLTVTSWDAGGGGMGGGGGGFFCVPCAPTQFGGGGMGGGGMPTFQTTEPSKPKAHLSTTDHAGQQVPLSWEAGLIQTIQQMTAPQVHWHDLDGEGGRMSVAGNRLLVRQSRKGHEQVVAVLEQLELAAEEAAAEE